MGVKTKLLSLAAGLAFIVGSTAAYAPERPAFDGIVDVRHIDPWSTDRCDQHRFAGGICRMFRPVRG